MHGFNTDFIIFLSEELKEILCTISIGHDHVYDYIFVRLVPNIDINFNLIPKYLEKILAIIGNAANENRLGQLNRIEVDCVSFSRTGRKNKQLDNVKIA